MPIQRKNEWIAVKGEEYTKFHAFINCQGVSLTANRTNYFRGFATYLVLILTFRICT